MGRGDRAKVRWANARKRKKKQREKAKATAAGGARGAAAR